MPALAASSAAWSSHAFADDAASSLPPPPLTFSLASPAVGAGGGPWKLRVENTGDVPVRIAADARLLVLEVTPPAGFVDPTKKPSKKPEQVKPARCVLPDDARPSTDEGRDLVIPAKRSWSTTVDPLMYCFGARERAMLVAGATVKAELGWPALPPKPGAKPPKKPVVPSAPFVAAPVGAAVGKVAPAKALQAAPITLAESAVPPLSASAASPSGTMAVTMADTLDMARGSEIPVTVTVTNGGEKAEVVLFRPETLRFAVSGPSGSVPCDTGRRVDSPIRELYSTLGVKARASITVLLNAMCPADTFDKAGIYRVTPVFDTTSASGRPIGLKTWDGAVSGPGPMLLRVRSQRRPSTPTARPALD